MCDFFSLSHTIHYQYFHLFLLNIQRCIKKYFKTECTFFSSSSSYQDAFDVTHEEAYCTNELNFNVQYRWYIRCFLFHSSSRMMMQKLVIWVTNKKKKIHMKRQYIFFTLMYDFFLLLNQIKVTQFFSLVILTSVTDDWLSSIV